MPSSGSAISRRGSPTYVAAIACSIGEDGRRHVTTHFTWDHVAAQMEDLYNSINPELICTDERLVSRFLRRHEAGWNGVYDAVRMPEGREANV